MTPLLNYGDIMKADKNFKLSKQVKRYMATMLDPVKRNAYKNAMIDAQLSASVPYKSEKTKKQ